jgi:hypothetical protein
MPALRQRVEPESAPLLQLEGRLRTFQGDIAILWFSHRFVEHPVGQNPVALGLHKDVIVIPRDKIHGGLEKPPEAQLETNAGVGAANQTLRVMSIQQVRV